MDNKRELSGDITTGSRVRPNPRSGDQRGSTYNPDFSSITAVSTRWKASFVEPSAERLDDNKRGQTSPNVHEF